MFPLWKSLAVVALIAGVPSVRSSAADLEWVRVSENAKGFVLAGSRRPFIPWGFNYDHEGDGALLEDHWDDKWPTVESAFREMNELGANVVRIHFQFGTFMESPTEPRQHSLIQLARLVRLGSNASTQTILVSCSYWNQDKRSHRRGREATAISPQPLRKSRPVPHRSIGTMRGNDETKEIFHGLTLIRCGGHFDGGTFKPYEKT